MEFEGTYRLVYSVDKEQKQVVVKVVLLEHEGLRKPNQNVYYGKATINSQEYNDTTILPYCVNARFAAEIIGIQQKEKIIAKCKKNGKRIKIIKEELK